MPILAIVSLLGPLGYTYYIKYVEGMASSTSLDAIKILIPLIALLAYFNILVPLTDATKDQVDILFTSICFMSIGVFVIALGKMLTGGQTTCQQYVSLPCHYYNSRF